MKQGSSASAASPFPELRAAGTISNAQMLDLQATPVTVIAAPGAGSWLEVVSSHLWFDYPSGLNYTLGGGNNDIILEDTDQVLALATWNATNFVDQTNDEHRYGGGMPTDYVVPDNLPLQIRYDSLGNLTGGLSPMLFEFIYRVRTLEFTP